MVLNMLSTATMVRLGYVSGNRMSNLQPKNIKLRERALRILMQETGLDADAATSALQLAGNDLSVALVMIKAQVELGPAIATLRKFSGRVEEALKQLGVR